MGAKYRLPKTNRITSDKEFKKIIFNGERIKGEYLSLFFYKGSRRSLGVSISKKVAGAVQRNRYRRILKEYFRLYQHTLAANTNILIIQTKVMEKPKLLNIKKVIDKMIENDKKISKKYNNGQ
jgi:ribonuclease P protein component